MGSTTAPTDRELADSEHFALPPMPGVVAKLLDALRAGTTAASEVADLLASDPALVAQVLKIVNSAYFGLPRRIAEIKHAVAYLGLAEIERIVLTASVLECFKTDNEDAFSRVWSHSFYTALVSKLLVRRFAPDIDPGELYTAALLHDVGKLVMLKFEPARFAEIDRHAVEHGCLFSEAELSAPTGESHRELGASLCDAWRLPGDIAAAARWHDDPTTASEHGDPVRLVSLSNLLATLASGELHEGTAAELRHRLADELHLDEREFLLLMGEVYELRGNVDEFLAQL